MNRLNESQETLNAIKEKAFHNAKKLGTYKTRSSFNLGRDVHTISELISKPLRRLQ